MIRYVRDWWHIRTIQYHSSQVKSRCVDGRLLKYLPIERKTVIRTLIRTVIRTVIRTLVRTVIRILIRTLIRVESVLTLEVDLISEVTIYGV